MDEAEQLCDRLVVIDEGKIVAEGSPSELIARHVSREVLELRFANGAERPDLAGAGLRTEALPDRLLVYAEDGDAALDAVRATGVHPATTLVRRSTLEDVFLRLTGRSLEE
jgi:lipooligosaccharide transport system ATP-binding protein